MTDTTNELSAAPLLGRIDTTAGRLLDAVDDLVEPGANTRDLANLTNAIANLAAARSKLQESGAGDGGGGGTIAELIQTLKKDPDGVRRESGNLSLLPGNTDNNNSHD